MILAVLVVLIYTHVCYDGPFPQHFKERQAQIEIIFYRNRFLLICNNIERGFLDMQAMIFQKADDSPECSSPG